MNCPFNVQAYQTLLVEVTPQVIKTEEEYKRQLELATAYHLKDSKTLEEQAIYNLLVVLIKEFDNSNETEKI